jgi:Arc/MetJ-type ribon-helix-helix transcriptional regulator
MTEILPPDLQQYVHQSIAAGLYPSEAEMMAEAVRALRSQDAELARFRSGLKERLAELERGHFTEVPRDQLGKFFDDLVAETDREMTGESGKPQ